MKRSASNVITTSQKLDKQHGEAATCTPNSFSKTAALTSDLLHKVNHGPQPRDYIPTVHPSSKGLQTQHASSHLFDGNPRYGLNEVIFSHFFGCKCSHYTT